MHKVRSDFLDTLEKRTSLGPTANMKYSTARSFLMHLQYRTIYNATKFYAMKCLTVSIHCHEVVILAAYSSKISINKVFSITFHEHFSPENELTQYERIDYPLPILKILNPNFKNSSMIHEENTKEMNV